ncbi:MAG: magnesium/cobalt efflux protein, partial [Betaproteobacteria bacterium]|nr:magnesium/cobalt efflux protein [Betaproteobacteria bacterium]
GRFRVKAVTELADFNEVLGSTLASEDFDTVGGLVVSRFGRLPKRGERIAFDGLTFQVLRADSRRLHSVLVEKVPPEEAPAP